MNSHSQGIAINHYRLMQKLLALAKRIDKFNTFLGKLSCWSIILMLGLGLWNVIGRYLGVVIGYNLSSNGLIEGQWYLFDVAFLLGIGWTLQKNGHVRVDIIQSRLRTNRKLKVELLGTLLLLLPFAIGITAISIQPALYSISINEASPDPHGLPRYLIRALIPMSFLCLTLQGLSEAVKNFAKIKAANAMPSKNGEAS